MTCPICQIKPDPNCTLCGTTTPKYELVVSKIQAEKSAGADLTKVDMHFNTGAVVTYNITHDDDDPVRCVMGFFEDAGAYTKSCMLGAVSSAALANTAALSMTLLARETGRSIPEIAAGIVMRASQMTEVADPE